MTYLPFINKWKKNVFWINLLQTFLVTVSKPLNYLSFDSIFNIVVLVGAFFCYFWMTSCKPNAYEVTSEQWCHSIIELVMAFSEKTYVPSTWILIFSTAVTLKIRLSLKSNQIFVMCQLYIHQNLIRILVYKILCREESVMLRPMPTPKRSTSKSICPPPPPVWWRVWAT